MNIKDRIYLAKLNAELTPGKPTKAILGLNERKELEALEELSPFGLAVIASEQNNYLEII